MNIEGVMDSLLERTEGQETVAVQNLLDAFSGRLFGPLLLVPGLLQVSPVGAIPLFPIVNAALLILIAGQRALGMTHPWLPSKLRDRGFGRARMEVAFEKLRPWAARVDRLIRPRLAFLVEPPMERAIAVLALAIALALPVIGLVPFAVAVPGAAITLLGLAVTARDGALALVGYLLTVGTFGLAWWAAVEAL